MYNELGTAITLLQDIPVGSYYEKLVPAGRIILEDSRNTRKQSLNGGRRELLFRSSFEGYTGYPVSSSVFASCLPPAVQFSTTHSYQPPWCSAQVLGVKWSWIKPSKTTSAIYIIQFITVGGSNQ